MKLRKSLAAMALVASMGISAVCAINVGMVNVQAVVQSYPGVQSYVQKENAVKSQYGPKLQQVAQQLQAEPDKAKAEKIYKESYLPLEQQAGEAVNAIWKDVFDKINSAITEVREDKNLPIVVSNPEAIVSAAEDTEGIDITKEVIEAVKK